MRSLFSSWALTVLVIASVTAQISQWSPLVDLAGLILVLFLIFALSTMRRRELPFFSLALATVAAALFYAADPLQVLRDGARIGSGYAGIVLSLSFLHAPANRSRLVYRCGEYLIRQGPGRRYLALTGGAHLFSNVLSIGTIGLLGAMVKRSNTLENAGGDPAIVAIRERRMVTAMLRGFGTMSLWSFSSIAPIIVLPMVPSVSWQQMIPYGLGLSVASMTLGWAMDRLTFSTAARTRVSIPPTADRAINTIVPLCGIVLALLFGVLFFKQVVGWSLQTSVVTVVPIASFIWLSLQGSRRGPAVALRVGARRFWRNARRLERLRYEVLAMSTSGFVGVGVTAMLPPGVVGHLMEALSLPPWGLLVGANALITLLSLVGVNPIVGVSVVGAALVHAGEALPPMAMVIALVGPWAVYAATSPLSAAVIMFGRMFDRDAMEIGLRWNGGYLVLGFLLQAAFIITLAKVG